MAFLNFRFVFCVLLLSLFKFGSAELGIPCGLGSGGFGYNQNASNGPDKWDLLDPAFDACGSGDMQSPIDDPGFENVEFDSPSKNPTPKFISTELKFECTNFNWELKCETPGNCGSTTFKGTKYNVVNQHFHSPSEHTLEGELVPLEGHTVHQDSSGNFLVIATFFQFGKKNKELQSILREIDDGTEEFKVILKKLINTDDGFCEYMGSLTTPPCTQTVTWLISIGTKAVTNFQVDKFVKTTGSAPFGNNRPLQPLNDRKVTCFVEQSNGGGGDDDDDDEDDDEDDDDDDDDDNDDSDDSDDNDDSDDDDDGNGRR